MHTLTKPIAFIIVLTISFSCIALPAWVNSGFQLGAKALAGTSWSQQEVATGGSFGSICMALDSSNNPHVAFEGINGLMYYGSWDGSRWIIQGVVMGGGPISLALDSNNMPHILYEGSNGVTYYASWNGANWSFLVVPSGARYSLALDSAGNPHLAYATQLLVKDYPSGVTDDIDALMYASWNGLNWTVEVVDAPISNTDGISLVLDKNDDPHIMYGYDVYYPPTGGNLLSAKVAVRNSSTWSTRTLLSNLDYYGNMVIDSNGKLHFVYEVNNPQASTSNATLGYASWDGARLSTQTINTALEQFTSADLALGPNNLAHIEYFNGALNYASLTGNIWSVETVAPNNFAYGEGPISLDSMGNPHICYWVDDIHNKTAFVSELIYTTPTPLPHTNPTSGSVTASSQSEPASASSLWSFLSNMSYMQSPIAANGYVYVSSVNSGAAEVALYCIDAATGAKVWEYDGLFSTFTVAGGYIFVGGASMTESALELDGGIFCLNAYTGEELWNYSAGTSFTTPLVNNGIVYACGFSYSLSSDTNVGTVYAFNASTGKLLWSFQGSVGTRFNGNPLALVGSNLYAMSAAYSSADASWHSGIYAFNAYTGNELWFYNTPGEFSSFIVSDQDLYVASDYVDTRNNIDAEKAGGYVYSGDVLALSVNTGKLVWNYAVDSSMSTPVAYENMVFAASSNGVLYAFNGSDGSVVWSYTAGTSIGSLLVAGSYLYAGSSWGAYCFDAETGRVIWNFASGDLAGSSATTPTFAQGVIYLGWNGPMFFASKVQHNFYALDAWNGQTLWNYTIDYAVSSAPVFMNGTLYVAGDFVSTRSPDFFSGGTVLALKPSEAFLPFTAPPSPSPIAASLASPASKPQTPQLLTPAFTIGLAAGITTVVLSAVLALRYRRRIVEQPYANQRLRGH